MFDIDPHQHIYSVYGLVYTVYEDIFKISFLSLKIIFISFILYLFYIISYIIWISFIFFKMIQLNRIPNFVIFSTWDSRNIFGKDFLLYFLQQKYVKFFWCSKYNWFFCIFLYFCIYFVLIILYFLYRYPILIFFK